MFFILIVAGTKHRINVQLALLDSATLEGESYGEEAQKKIVCHEHSQFFCWPTYSLLFQEVKAANQNGQNLISIELRVWLTETDVQNIVFIYHLYN